MSRLRRAWHAVDVFCAAGVNGLRELLGLRPLPLSDAQVDARLDEVELRYQTLVRDVAAQQGHRRWYADVADEYRCECGQVWSNSTVHGPFGACPVGWPIARRAIKRHHDYGHSWNLDLGQGADLCTKYGCPNDPAWRGDRK